ncbi:MAG: tetratricopeptide repeat protein, partial [Stellaceae bacterium]
MPRIVGVLRALGLAMFICGAASGIAGAADGSVRVEVFDRLGRTFPVLTVVSGQDGKEVSRSATPGEPATVPPGRWLVMPAGALDRAKLVDLADGASETVRIDAADAVWLRLYHGDKTPVSYLLMRQKAPDVLAELLPRLRFVPNRNQPLALPRPEASAAQRATALRVAREELAKSFPTPKPDDPPNPPWRAATAWANRILDAIGEASDVHDMDVTARIENRLGLLGKGKIAAAIGSGDDPATSAALLLHEAGFDAGDALILESGADAKRAWVFGALLDFPPEQVQADMVAAATHYAARYKEIAAGSQDQWNSYESAALPAILFLMAHGPVDALATLLDNFDAYQEDIQVLAVAAADPAQFFESMLTDSGLDAASSEEDLQRAAVVNLPEALALLCGAAETLSRADAEALWTRLYNMMSQHVYAKADSFHEPGDWARRFSIYAPGNFLTRAGHCTTNHWVTGQYLAKDGGNWSGWIPYMDWIPRYWDEKENVDLLVKNPNNLAGTSNVLDQLDLIPHERLEQLLAAEGAAADQYPINVYRAYHAVATHANGAFPAFPIRVASDTEVRPYVMGRTDQPGTYDTVVAGIARLRPELVGTKLRLHLSFEQLASYSAHFQIFGRDDLGGQYKPADGGQRYLIDRGRALVESVRLWRENSATQAAPIGLDSSGALLYEAELGKAGLDGLIAEVDLAFFDDRRQLVFALYGDDYAARLRRAARASAVAEAALKDRPDALEVRLALARAEADLGQIEPAIKHYLELLAAQPTAIEIWSEAASAASEMGEYQAAAGVLRSGFAANPGTSDLLTQLANTLFLGRSYA